MGQSTHAPRESPERKPGPLVQCVLDQQKGSAAALAAAIQRHTCAEAMVRAFAQIVDGHRSENETNYVALSALGKIHAMYTTSQNAFMDTTNTVEHDEVEDERSDTISVDIWGLASMLPSKAPGGKDDMAAVVDMVPAFALRTQYNARNVARIASKYAELQSGGLGYVAHELRKAADECTNTDGTPFPVVRLVDGSEASDSWLGALERACVDERKLAALDLNYTPAQHMTIARALWPAHKPLRVTAYRNDDFIRAFVQAHESHLAIALSRYQQDARDTPALPAKHELFVRALGHAGLEEDGVRAICHALDGTEGTFLWDSCVPNALLPEKANVTEAYLAVLAHGIGPTRPIGLSSYVLANTVATWPISYTGQWAACTVLDVLTESVLGKRLRIETANIEPTVSAAIKAEMCGYTRVAVCMLALAEAGEKGIGAKVLAEMTTKNRAEAAQLYAILPCPHDPAFHDIFVKKNARNEAGATGEPYPERQAQAK